MLYTARPFNALENIRSSRATSRRTILSVPITHVRASSELPFHEEVGNRGLMYGTPPTPVCQPSGNVCTKSKMFKTGFNCSRSPATGGNRAGVGRAEWEVGSGGNRSGRAQEDHLQPCAPCARCARTPITCLFLQRNVFFWAGEPASASGSARPLLGPPTPPSWFHPPPL